MIEKELLILIAKQISHTKKCIKQMVLEMDCDCGYEKIQILRQKLEEELSPTSAPADGTGQP